MVPNSNRTGEVDAYGFWTLEFGTMHCTGTMQINNGQVQLRGDCGSPCIFAYRCRSGACLHPVTELRSHIPVVFIAVGSGLAGLVIIITVTIICCCRRKRPGTPTTPLAPVALGSVGGGDADSGATSYRRMV